MYWRIVQPGPHVTDGAPTRWRPWGIKFSVPGTDHRRLAKSPRWRMDFRHGWLRLIQRMPDDGMTTAEYAIGTVAAAALASVLYTVVTGESIVSGLTSLIHHALAVTF